MLKMTSGDGHKERYGIYLFKAPGIANFTFTGEINKSLTRQIIYLWTLSLKLGPF
jgi:hypothetical protein